MKSDYLQEMQAVEQEEQEIERSQQMSSDKKVQKMRLIKKLRIGETPCSESESSGEDLDQISLNTVKDLYENSVDGMMDQESLVRKQRKKKSPTDEMNLSEIERNLEDGEDQMKFLDVDLRNSTDQMLVFRKWPFQQWAIGMAIIIIGAIMMNFLIKKQDQQGYHYITAIAIIVLGLFFIFYGKIHIIEIDKSTQQIRKN